MIIFLLWFESGKNPSQHADRENLSRLRESLSKDGPAIIRRAPSLFTYLLKFLKNATLELNALDTARSKL